MNAGKVAGIVLVLAGILGLVYKNFSFTQEETLAKVGSVELTADTEKTINLPLWLSIGAIAVGGVLLVVGNKR